MVRKLMSKIKYPKLLVFLVTILIAAIIFWEWMHSELIDTFFLVFRYSWDFCDDCYSLLIYFNFSNGNFVDNSKRKVLWISYWSLEYELISNLVIYLCQNSLLQEVTMFKEESYVIKFRNFLKIHFDEDIDILCLSYHESFTNRNWNNYTSNQKNVSMKLFMVITYILHTIGITTIYYR